MRNSLSETRKAVTKYNAGDSRSDIIYDIGLAFNVDLVYRILNEAKCADSVNRDAAIAMSAVFDYLVVEVIDLAGNVCRRNERIYKCSRC